MLKFPTSNTSNQVPWRPLIIKGIYLTGVKSKFFDNVSVLVLFLSNAFFALMMLKQMGISPKIPCRENLIIL